MENCDIICITVVIFIAPDMGPVLFVLDLHMKYTVEVVHLCTYSVWFVIV